MQILRALTFGPRLRWFLGETLVVVVGVLIALAVNSLWTTRYERDLELQYLQRIHADVVSDVEFIDEFIKDTVSRKLAALNAIAPVVRGEEPIPADKESFLRNVALGGLGGVSATNWATSTTFEDMKATGNLRLIQDSELRQRIARYYYDFDQLQIRSRDRTTGYASFVHSAFPAELREELNSAAIEEFGIDRAVEKFLTAEFLDVLNQEYNYAFFNRNIDSSSARELLVSLEQAIARLER